MSLNSFERKIDSLEAYKMFSSEFDLNIDFLQDLCYLIDGGHVISFFADDFYRILDTSLIDSSVKTLRSIKMCCSQGSFSDANTLIRKLRDDLLLYIYILNIINNRKPFIESNLKKFSFNDGELNVDKFTATFENLRFNNILTDDEKTIYDWFNNIVDSEYIKKNLRYEYYMKCLRQNSSISKILVNYNLENYWEKLRTYLNNYVHNKGLQFAHDNLVSAYCENIEIDLRNINIRISYILSFFLVLIIMLDATLIASTDYIDYLESNQDPPEGCQYWIAQFIQEYIDQKVTKLHPELKQYLKEQNIYGMKIE